MRLPIAAVGVGGTEAIDWLLLSRQRLRLRPSCGFSLTIPDDESSPGAPAGLESSAAIPVQGSKPPPPFSRCRQTRYAARQVTLARKQIFGNSAGKTREAERGGCSRGRGEASLMEGKFGDGFSGGKFGVCSGLSGVEIPQPFRSTEFEKIQIRKRTFEL
eukprot:2938929-Rhodomonas_salina.2